MAITSYKLPTSVIQNGTGVNAWADPNNILLVDGDFAVASGPASEILVGGFNISLGQLDTITNITLKVKGYRGSYNTTLAIYAVDDTSGVEISYPYAPSFQGFDGTNTVYTLASSLFGTTWTPDKINNIKLKLVADGTLYLDSVEMAVTYTPGVVPVPPAPSNGQVVVDEFVQGIRFQLAQAMTSTDLFLFAESFTMPDGTPIEYADFHGEALITVDQGILGSEENIRISNVEHDYNGTGLVRISIDALADRGLGFIYPYESDATRIKAHGGTAEFVISNSAPFYNRFLRRNQIDALVSAPIYFEEEGVALADPVHTVDFVGSAVTVTNDGVDSFKKIVTITGGAGGGHVIQDNGVVMPTEPALNFTDYFTLTDVAGVSTDVEIDVVGLAGDATFINTLTSNVNFQNAVNTFVSGSGVLQIDQTPDNGTYGLLAGDVDGVNDTYTVSLAAYAAGKLQVYLNGLIQLQGASDDFIELVPGSGTFQFNTPPTTGDIITVVYSGSASVVDNYTVKVTTNDTAPSFLDDKINIHSSDSSVTVTKTITNPSGNEIIDIDLTTSGSVLTVTTIDDFIQNVKTAADTATERGVSGNFIIENVSGADPAYVQLGSSETDHPGIVDLSGPNGGELYGFTNVDSGFTSTETRTIPIGNDFNFSGLFRSIRTGASFDSIFGLCIDGASGVGGGVWARFSNSISATKIVFYDGAVQTTTAIDLPTSNAWTTFEIDWTAGTSTLVFKIGGTTVYSGTPTFTGTNIGFYAGSVGGTAGTKLSFDYITTTYTVTR